MIEGTTFEKQNGISTLDLNSTISYAELISIYCSYLTQNRKSKQEIKNARSAIKSWCDSLKFNLNFPPGREFSDQFEVFKQRYSNEQNRLHIKKNTYSSRLSIVKAARNFYLSQIKIHSLPVSFGKRLLHLLNVNNYSVKKFWEYHLSKFIGYPTFSDWSKDLKIPSQQKLFAVEIIEHELELPVGILMSTLKINRNSSKELEKTSYGQKMSNAGKKKYWIWTEALETEFRELLDFKTSVVLPFGMNRKKGSVWTGGDKENLPPSAQIAKGHLLSFFGYCCLPVDNPDIMICGLGFNKEDLSLALLTEASIVERYITVFRVARAGGKYNDGMINFISLLTSLLRKETGYLYQKPEFARKLQSPETKFQWEERCLVARRRLLDIQSFIEQEKSSGGGNFGFGRDPGEPIKEILEANRPIHFIMQMIKDMLIDVAKFAHNPDREAVLFRDMFLILLLQINPLRIKMFSIMKFGEHLVKRKDGSWWLKFKRHEFKNRHSLKSDYEVRVAPEIWHIIDDYINNFRPKLFEAESSSYVFLGSKQSSSKLSRKEGLSPSYLSVIVNLRTKEYILGCRGFGPHAFRHIIATDVIKNNPGFGFFLASRVLHDKVQTVEAKYAHLKTSEFFEPYNKHLSETWESFDYSGSVFDGSFPIDINQDIFEGKK